MRSLIAHACLIAALVFTSANGHAQTAEEYNDPGYWQRQKASVQGRNNEGGHGPGTLAERAEACEELSLRVDKEVMHANGFIIDYHIIASPSRGYITQGAAATDQREIGTYATVAFRDIRAEKYNGSNLGRCREIASYAIERIRNVLRKYPDFDKYPERVSKGYR